MADKKKQDIYIKRLLQLDEELQAVYSQLGKTLSEVDGVKLKRQAERIEQEIEETKGKLEVNPAFPESIPPIIDEIHTSPSSMQSESKPPINNIPPENGHKYSLCKDVLGRKEGIVGLIIVLISFFVVSLAFSNDLAEFAGQSICWSRAVFATIFSLTFLVVGFCAWQSKEYKKPHLIGLLILLFLLSGFLWYYTVTCDSCFPYQVQVIDKLDRSEVAGAEVQLILDVADIPKDSTDVHGYAYFCIDSLYEEKLVTHVVNHVGYERLEEDLRLSEENRIPQFFIIPKSP